MNDNGQTRILVAGATGMLGAPVARRLMADGFRVRVLARDATRAANLFGTGAEIVAGDVTRPDTLIPAVRDCGALYVSLRGNFDTGEYASVEVGGLENLLSSARQAGVRRIAMISGAGQNSGNENLLPVRIKMRAEELIRSSGVAWTIFRCTHFMESLDLFVRGNRAIIIGRQPCPFHYLAAVDYAAMVSRAFSLEAAAGQAFTILGPEPFTMRQALDVYIRELAPHLKLGMTPDWVLRLIGRLSRKQELVYLADLFASFPRVGEIGDPEPANSLLGKPATTLVEWCAARKAGR